MSKKNLSKYLKELSRDELIKEVEKLYGKFKLVQEYYKLELSGDSTELLQEFKRKLDRVFTPRGNFINPNISEANKIINQFSKLSIHALDTIDLMLYKVELIQQFLEEWGHDFTSMINSYISTYSKVVDMIQEGNLEDIFRKRCEHVEAYAMNYFLLDKTL